ncbi:hypothetical protein V2A60_002184 [Cordyceps javanica]
MVFSAPAWVPSPGQDAPDRVPIGDFVLSNHASSKKDAPFVDAISGNVYTMDRLRQRVDSIARGLASDLNWSPNTGSPWEKVVAIYSLNTKLAMLTHHGIITNLLQMSAFEDFANDPNGQTVAAAIPFSHSYGILIGHVGILRAESHIVFPRFDMQLMLGSVASYHVNRLYLDVENYNESGEVYYKAPNMFVGYLGDRESTLGAFDDSGWLRTGDMGAIQVSPNGVEHLFIRDRIKDMIKVKGMQVIPADVESVLLAHPAVADAAVIGVPDELAGERAMAFVIRSGSVMSDLSEDDLQDSINDHMEDKLHETHWLGDRLEFVSEIPKSQSGKVLKRMLKAQAATV